MEAHNKTNEQLVRELAELRHVTELRQNAEERLRTQNPSPTGAMTDAEIGGLVHELQVHQIELEMQNDEFVQAQAELRESSEKYGNLFDFAPIGYFVWGELGQILEVNLSGATLLGLDRKAAINKRFGLFVDLEDRVAFSEFCKQVLRADGKQRCELKLQIGDQRLYVLIEAVAVRGCQGKATSCRAAVMDITDRKKTEEALRKSEASLRDAQEVACLGFYRLDIPRGRWTSSEVLDRIFDIPFDYVRSVEGWGNLVHPDERQMMLDYFRTEVFGKHETFDREYRIVRYGDHQVRWVHGRGRLEFDAGGHPIGMLGTIQDITERKRAEKILQESEQQYRQLFNNMINGFMVAEVICDESGEPCDHRFVQANPAFESLTGTKIESHIGKTSKDLSIGWPPDVRQSLYKVAMTGEAIHYERYNETLGRSYDTSVFSPRPGHFAIVFDDITERKRVEQEKLEMERRLLHAQKLESLGILAGGIAHDFNNILAGIMGYADLVKVQLPASEPARKDLDIIKKAVQRAADLTRQMLAYSGKGKFIVEPVNLSRIVKDMRAMLEMSISKKATLNCNLATTLPMIEADASQIHQIILNLVINASEALGEESGVITISTDTIHCGTGDCAALGDDVREGLYVRLEVTDTGCGMGEQTLAKIFDPFFTTKFTGRGLGLAAVHGILRGHKGGIRVTSKPGQGTTFQVLFPAIESPVPFSTDESIPAKPWHGTGTVLVVDDEEIVRSLAKRMVEEAGFSVLTANDGEEAVRLYREHQNEIACVLLDLTMPKMNGEETFRAIRQIAPDVRVILSSGYSEESATGRFSGMGLAGFIQKPYQLDTMVATLREAVGGNTGKIHPA